MENILIKGERLLLRRAAKTDVDYIVELQHKEENLPFIVPYERDKQIKALAKDSDTMNIIIAERENIAPVGYFFVSGLTDKHKSLEWTHVIIDKKGRGYGHESMKLLKKWTFAIKKFHRACLDCKEYNARALHLYESEGLVREGVLREVILCRGVYENLVVLSILEQEYYARIEQGLEF